MCCQSTGITPFLFIFTFKFQLPIHSSYTPTININRSHVSHPWFSLLSLNPHFFCLQLSEHLTEVLDGNVQWKSGKQGRGEKKVEHRHRDTTFCYDFIFLLSQLTTCSASYIIDFCTTLCSKQVSEKNLLNIFAVHKLLSSTAIWAVTSSALWSALKLH